MDSHFICADCRPKMDEKKGAKLISRHSNACFSAFFPDIKLFFGVAHKYNNQNRFRRLLPFTKRTLLIENKSHFRCFGVSLTDINLENRKFDRLYNNEWSKIRPNYKNYCFFITAIMAVNRRNQLNQRNIKIKHSFVF